MQGAGVGHVLDPGDGRLRTQLAVRRRQVERHLEYRIDAKTVGVVAVLAAGGDHQEAEADDVGESVRDLIRCAPILDTASKSAAVARPRAASGRRRPMTANHHRMLQRRICRRQVTGRATAA